MQFRRILVAADDSMYSMQAAMAAFALGRQLAAEMAVVCVVDKAKEVVNADLGITPENSRTVLLEEADRVITQCVDQYGGDMRVSRFTPEGTPEKELLRVAEEWKADLIVMGTHGRSGLGRMFAGSVAGYVIRNATIPVMVMPPGVAPITNA
ncbi:MAG TPA: universal stress protein [Puia sp.]|jgi:nucleotide-binding universal stress UspA family protein|nr:universal stress protein [Puia sp.]